jgi:Cys-tRNA(Pro) deacylase
MTETPATRDLASRGVAFRIFRHLAPVHSLEQAARERGQHPDQVIRSILFRVSQDEFVMVLVAGEEQVDWRTLRGYLGRSRLTMASEEEVLQVTGYPLGAVTPFGLPSPIRILVDETVFARQGEVSIGSGVRGAAIILDVEELRHGLGDVEIGRFVKIPS